jgi:hypothetical protein
MTFIESWFSLLEDKNTQKRNQATRLDISSMWAPDFNIGSDPSAQVNSSEKLWPGKDLLYQYVKCLKVFPIPLNIVHNIDSPSFVYKTIPPTLTQSSAIPLTAVRLLKECLGGESHNSCARRIYFLNKIWGRGSALSS